MRSQNLKIVAGVVFTACVAGYVTVYLPFYSMDLEDLQRKAAARGPSQPKSVWANLDREIKENKKDS